VFKGIKCKPVAVKRLVEVHKRSAYSSRPPVKGKIFLKLIFGLNCVLWYKVMKSYIAEKPLDDVADDMADDVADVNTHTR